MSDVQTHGYTFEFVAARLSEAGMTLLALHVPGTRPAGYRCFWPDVPGSTVDDQRPSPPPAQRITRMDEALRWISLIPEDQVALRKLVGARALTSPRNEKPIFSWPQLGRQMGCSHKTAKTWWISGIELITRRLNQPGLCERPELQGAKPMADAALRQASARLTRAVRQTELA